jgi:hypothetical protein
MAKKAKSAAVTLRIRVAPDHKAPKPYPQVLLTERNAKAPGTPTKVQWRKLPSSKKFEMVGLDDLNAVTVFKNATISASKKRLECDFDPPAGDPPDTPYDYRLRINYKGTEYNTDYRGPGPAGGKAVIRN